MARSLTVVVLCLCLTVAFAADLRRLIAERAALTPQTAKIGADGKPTGDLDTANSWGYGWGGGPWGGFGGGWGGGYGGWGPWGYGWGGPWGGYGGGFGGGWW